MVPQRLAVSREGAGSMQGQLRGLSAPLDLLLLEAGGRSGCQTPRAPTFLHRHTGQLPRAQNWAAHNRCSLSESMDGSEPACTFSHSPHLLSTGHCSKTWKWNKMALSLQFLGQLVSCTTADAVTSCVSDHHWGAPGLPNMALVSLTFFHLVPRLTL